MSDVENRAPAIPSSVTKFDDFDAVVQWIHKRGFVDDETVVDIQMSTDPTGLLRIDDITTEDET